MKHLTSDLIRKNRASFRAAPDWLPSDVYQASRYCYGVSSAALPLLNEPIDDAPTYTDLLTAAALEFGRPVNYLEIGVSVGKNFYGVARALDDARLFGMDWENLNPVLERLLTRAQPAETALPTFQIGTNVLHYVQGDEFATETWRPLAGTTFDVVFSDAWHQGTALLTEYKMIRTLGLLNWREFFFMWDDLRNPRNPSMDRAYREICLDMQRQAGGIEVRTGITEVNGWLGQHESPHCVGWATTLPIDAASLQRTLAAMTDGCANLTHG